MSSAIIQLNFPQLLPASWKIVLRKTETALLGKRGLLAWGIQALTTAWPRSLRPLGGWTDL